MVPGLEVRSSVYTGDTFFDSPLTPTEVLDLINAAMHPTTETETR
jgi:hypothetical protein